MPIYFLGKSNRKNKKFYVRQLNGNKSIHFGDSRYEDYTMHKDEDRKYRYLVRHKKKEDWLNPVRASFWSRWLLWNRRSLRASIKDLKNKFGIKVRIIK